MGKATIISEIGQGQYRVKVEFSEASRTRQINRLRAEINKITELELPNTEMLITDLNNQISEAQQQLDELIQGFSEGTVNQQQYDNVNIQVLSLRAELSNQVNLQNSLNLMLTTLNDELNRVESLSLDLEVDAWCADFTLGLVGEVGTIEDEAELFEVEPIEVTDGIISGGGSALKPPIIRPGFFGASGFVAERDGQFSSAILATPEAAFYYAALLPGVQKWLPKYRLGVVSQVKETTLDITLDEARSNFQNLDINQGDALVDVPVLYMDCGVLAFSANDRVIVEFIDRDFAKPIVIGFESNPKLCATGFICRPVSDNAPSGWGQPFFDSQGGPINPPLGTVGGTNRQISLSRVGNTWAVNRGIVANFGSQLWRRQSQLITFNGATIFRHGQPYSATPSGQTLRGAAITTTGEFIVAITSSDDDLSLWRRVNTPDLTGELFESNSNGWQLIATFPEFENQLGWGHFWSINSNCNRAVSIQRFVHPAVSGADPVSTSIPPYWASPVNQTTGTTIRYEISLTIENIDSESPTATISNGFNDYIYFNNTRIINETCSYVDPNNDGTFTIESIDYSRSSSTPVNGRHTLEAAFSTNQLFRARVRGIGASSGGRVENLSAPNISFRNGEINDDDDNASQYVLEVGGSQLPLGWRPGFDQGRRRVNRSVSNSSISGGDFLDESVFDNSDILLFFPYARFVLIGCVRTNESRRGAFSSDALFSTRELNSSFHVVGYQNGRAVTRQVTQIEQSVTNSVTGNQFDFLEENDCPALFNASTRDGSAASSVIENQTVESTLKPFGQIAPGIFGPIDILQRFGLGSIDFISGQEDGLGNVLFSLRYTVQGQQRTLNYITDGDVESLIGIQNEPNARLFDIGVI